MELISLEMVGLLAAAMVLLRLPLPPLARCALLVALSGVFLATFSPWAPLVLLATSLHAYLLATKLPKSAPRAVFVLLCVPFLVPLFLPKLAGAASADAGLVANDFGAKALLFIGSSYFTLRALHFVLDARRTGRAALPFVEFIAWNSFFPTIVAGPIERAQHFAASLGTLGRASFEDVREALWRILLGLFKRVVVAAQLLPWAADIQLFEPGTDLTTLDAWLALYAICLYAYFDFSGYSDLAIGAARLLGIRLAENFKHPYLRPNITEFWQGWHISLSFWIRDYLFLPLCGRSSSKLRPHVAALTAMTLCGLWHAPALGWLVWGFLHGAGLSVHQVWTGWLRKRFALKKRLASSWLVRIVATLITFHFVALTWVAISVDANAPSKALAYVAQLFGVGR